MSARALPLFALLFLFGFASSARAQVTPVDIGASTGQAVAPGVLLSITTTASVPAGASIIVTAVATRTGTSTQVTGATCSDNAGNSYNIDVSQNGGTRSLTIICSTHNLAAQLNAGSTITVTWSGGSGGQNLVAHAFSVTGLASAPLDKTASAVGHSNSPSSGSTATTAQPNELLFGVIMDESSNIIGAGFTPGVGYTLLSANDMSAQVPSLFSEYRNVSATGSYAADGTLGSSSDVWHALLATYKIASCMMTCPPNKAQSNDANQCGAVVTYNAPTTSGPCGTVVCSPASGSFFPVGTTTVSCDASGTTANPDCTFTVTVVDTQPPTLTCPANVTSVTPAPGGGSAVVTFPPPTASDNCPSVTTACNPPSGSTFPVGCTTVTCTATDTPGNTATCSFQACVFNLCLQDDSNPNNRIVINAATGDYRFCCNGTTLTGRGKMTIQGSTFTLEHNALDRRVRASVTASQKVGNASLQMPPGKLRCNITDSNTSNNTNCTTCQ